MEEEWDAVDHATQSITGDLGFLGTSLWLNGNTYPLDKVRTLPAAQSTEFASALAVEDSSDASVDLYRTMIPGNASLPQGNTLCQGSDALWMTVVTTPSGTISTFPGGDLLTVTFFMQRQEPGLTATAMAKESDGCGLFKYERVAGGSTSTPQ